MKKTTQNTCVLPLGNLMATNRFIMRSALAILSIFILNTCYSQTTLLNETFGTGTTFPTGWTASSTDWTAATTNPSTTYAGASGGTNAYFTPTNVLSKTLTYSNNLSTVNYTNITVMWGGRYVSLASTNYTINVVLSWSANGLLWNDVTYTNVPVSTTGAWGLVNNGTRIALPAGAAGIPNLRIRFTATASSSNASSTNTIYRIDDVTISGCPVSAGSISYGGSPFCKSLTAPQPVTPSINPGGTYSSTAGLSIDPSTGEITPSTSTAGTYTVTYTLGCAAVSTTTSITITAAPSATISYSAAPFCKSVTAAQSVTLTGTSGGTFSSTTGLSINTSSGAITPSTSTAGTYIVTYAVAAAGGCAAFSTTATVTITTAPSATISYAASPYCSSITATQPVARSGTTGGTFSTTAGLSINSTTGDISPSASTTGTYTVTYTVAAYGGCAAFTTTTSVTITAAPSATVTYPGSPFCKSVATAQSVTVSGTAGGTFSAGTGLSINTTTGAVTPSTSTAGTYTVTYTVAASGGCSAFSTTATVTITNAPSATISYSGSPFCKSLTAAQSATLSGTTGGTFSAISGLSLNASTGEITPSASTAGTYTVTYTVAASGGCATFSTTASVTISAIPSASISYSGTPFCNTVTSAQAVTLTGTSGGMYSSTSGLSINTTTGDVTPSTSTANTYTVTYTVAAAGGCAAFSTTAAVTITALPSATISYAGSPFCSDAGIATVTMSGSSGGSYSSTTGLAINSSTGTVNLATSTAGTYTVTYTIAAASGCSAVAVNAPLIIRTAGIWTGAISNDYNNAQNWLCGSIPAPATNVVIPSGLSVYPVVTGTSVANNISIANGASLRVNGTLQLTGVITNNGKFSATAGTVEFDGSTAQQIAAGLFDSSLVKNLTINNAAGVTLATTLNLTGILKITTGQLNTGDKLVLKSSATGTAMIAPITSAAATPVNGKVTVERYVPGRRKYRLITSPVTTSTATVLSAGQENLSIWGAWQNSGVNTPANTGTFITGGSNADGFDIQTTNASLFTYDDVNRRFVGFTTANGKKTKYTPLKAGVAYYMFVYGDRVNTITTSSPNNTVLSATGTLLTGDQAYTTTSTMPLSPVVGRFTFLGNPFASAINWATIPKTNLDNAYWGWDPNLSNTGGYVTVLTSGAVTLQAPFTGSTGINQYIQPGQGFFVKTAAAAPTLTIREQDKVTNFNPIAFRMGGADSLGLLAVNLFYNNGSTPVLADGVLTAFDRQFSTASEEASATKMLNSTENIALVKDTNWLSIQTRPLPRNNDTVLLKMWRLTRPQYTLQIFSQHLAGSGLQAYLHDQYLDTLQLLSLTDTNNITFNVMPGVPASSDTNRFKIVFRSGNGPLPVKYTLLTAAATGKNVHVHWAVADQTGIQQYLVEKATDGISFTTAGVVKAKENTATAYTWLDTNPAAGSNYYRVRAVQKDGDFFLSETALVKMIPAVTSISISPNPTNGNQLTIRSGEMEKGIYSIRILNIQGQQIMSQTIHHAGGAFTQTIRFEKTLPAGLYFFKIENGTTQNHQTFFVQ